MHVPTQPSLNETANEHTAITIALRVPTFANCCGPVATGIHTAAISSSTDSLPGAATDGADKITTITEAGRAPAAGVRKKSAGQ